MNIRLAALAIALCATAPASAYEKLPNALAGLSVADFVAGVNITDNPLEPAVVVSTRDAYTRSRSIEGALADDVHLRALIDRGTGRVTWQVWHDLAYVGARKEVETVHYLSGGTEREARPSHVDHWLDRCPPTDQPGQCNEAMRIAFELPEATVREIAGGYTLGSRSPWRLRFKDARGRDVIGGLAPAEVAGILQAVEEWRRKP